jgi:hypothetical protein
MADNSIKLMKHERYYLTNSEQLIDLYRADPVMAAHDLLGIRLIWLQRIALRTMWFKLYVALNWGRGTSKTFILALFCVLKAMLYPGMRIGVFAPSFRQQGFIFDEIERMMSNSPFLRMCVKGGKISRGQGRIYMQIGKSMIEALPTGHDGGKARGRRYGVVVCDEYAQILPDIIKLVIRPMLNIKIGGVSNQFIVASSAFYKWNHFYGLWCHYKVMEEKFPEQYGVLDFDYRDILMTKNSPFEVDTSIIDAQKSDMPHELFLMENLSVFPDESVGYFPAKLLEEATPKRTPIAIEPNKGDHDGIYTLGIDCARTKGGDNFSVAVSKVVGGKIHLVRLESMNGKPFQEMVYLIRVLLRDYPMARIYNDYGGGGQAITDLLNEPWADYSSGRRVDYPPILDIDEYDEYSSYEGNRILKQFKFSNDSKSAIFSSFKADLENGVFKFPLGVFKDDDPDVERIGLEIKCAKSEFMVVMTEPTSHGYRFVTPENMRDDRATSIILSHAAARDIMKIERETGEVEDVPMPSVGVWVGDRSTL